MVHSALAMNQNKPKKTVVITGTGRAAGLGFETAKQLGALGYRVVVTARDPEVASARASELRQLGFEGIGEQLDVVRPDSIDALVARLRALGHVDVLVNNAASAPARDQQPSNADLGEARRSLESILFGSWLVAQRLLPLLLLSPHPRIVNVSSGAGSHGDAQFGLTTANAIGPGYAVAKAALNALTSALARELGEHCVLVNAVCPGFTATFPGAEAMGARPVAEGARGIVWAATLPDDGPSGGFFRDGNALSW